MLSKEKILSGMRCTRSEFAQIFFEAQNIRNIDETVAFEAISSSTHDNINYLNALNYSTEKDFTSEILSLIIERNLEDGSLAQEMTEVLSLSCPGDSRLEAVLDFAAGFDLPKEAYRGINRGMRMTGKISIDGIAKGTCILIQPDMVLTSWHVLKDFFVADNGIYKQTDNDDREITVEFEDFLSLVGTSRLSTSKKIIFKAHKDWCVIFCDCHLAELQNSLPNNLTELEGYWDYVIVRLEQSPGFERDWERMEKAEQVPKPEEKIIVFQHPDGQGLRMHDREIAVSNLPDDSIFPGLRFLHSANTLHGSSGGPCFNKNFKFFGIHQGVWNNGIQGKLNRGVPIGRINEHLHNAEIILETDELSQVSTWRIEAPEFTPIVGCDQFKNEVFGTISDSSTRILQIVGNSGAGKSFRLKILKSILPLSTHLLIELKAANITKMDAAQLALEILSCAGDTESQIPEQEEFNSTTTVWIKSALVPVIINGLQNKKLDRMVWLSIADLNKYKFEYSSASDLLIELYEQVQYQEWLRIVLDDLQMSIPLSLRKYVKKSHVTAITYDHFEQFFMRLNLGAKLHLDDGAIAVSSRDAFERYNDAFDDDPGTAGFALKKEIKFKVEKVLKKAIKTTP